jgi:small-conductance mechanosensitive channel
LAASIVFLLIAKTFVKKYGKMRSGRQHGLGLRIVVGTFWVSLTALPYGVLVASLFILFGLFPSFPVGQSLALLFFTIMFFYRLSLEIFRLLLSPDDNAWRLIPIGDENANYLWVWLLRFAHYTALYFLVLQTLQIVQVVGPAFAFIRGVLLMVFPCMISIFILQVAREIRMNYEKSSNESGEAKDSDIRFTKLLRPVVRYWPALGVAYFWLIFIFLMVHYGSGFRYLLSASLWTSVTIVAVLIALRLKEWIFKKFFAINEKVQNRFPGLEERTNRYILILKRVFRTVIILLGVGVIAQIWGIPVNSMVSSNTGTLIILRGLAILITIGVVMAILETTEFLSDHLLTSKRKGKKKREVTQKMKTLVPMVRAATKMAAGFVGGIIILDRLGVNTTPILAGAGIVGLAVGFGSQTLVKDLINGLFILFEESVRVGDYAVLGQNEGIVEAVGLRTIRLRDVSGNVHVVPNSTIDALTNMTKEFSRTVIDIGVAYREDVDEVISILKEVGESMRTDPEYGNKILEPMEVFGLQKFDDSAVVIRVRMTTKPLSQWGIKREFNRRVKRIFDQRGIEIPFPHRTIYMGEPKQGHAAALHVQMAETS